MSFTQLERNQSALAGQCLGHLLWWQLDGNHIAHQRLTALATKHGLDARHLPADIKPTQAFRRAWRQLRLTDGLMLRPIAETEQEVVIGLVRERPDAVARDLDYDVVTRIGFDKGAGTITADGDHDVVSRLREAYDHHLAHTTEDIRAMLSSFLNEAGIRLRDSGGVYFVPVSHQQQLDALCAVVEATGGNTTYRLPITDAGKTTLRQVAKRTLDEEIQALQAELDRFDPDKVRDSTLERKLAGFDELRARVHLFSRVLSFRASAMTEKIAAIQTGLRAQLGSGGQNVVAIKPAPPPAELPTEKPEPATTFEPFSAVVGF